MKPYDITERLRTPEEMEEYLIACYEEGGNELLRKGVKDVVAAALKLNSGASDDKQEPIGFVDQAYVDGRKRGREWGAEINYRPIGELVVPLYLHPEAKPSDT
jgi:hypothetical protein